MTASTPAPVTAEPPAVRGRWLALTVLLLALAMALVDITVVNLALPSITAGLGASESTLSWVVAGYVLAYGVALVPAGRLGDRYGHKWVFVAGVALYVATGLACALATNQLMLVSGRVLHGLAGGLMVPPVTALIQLTFTGVSRVRAFGLFSATTGAASLIGPVVGGWALDTAGETNGWRWAMSVGLPLGVLALALAVPLLPPLRGETHGRFDIVGMVLLSLTLLGFLLPLIQTEGGSLPAWAPEVFAGAAALAVAFVLWQRHRERTGALPLLPVSLFRRPSFSLGLLMATLAFASFTSSIYIAMSTLWQSGRGETAVAAALVMLPFAVGSVVGGGVGDRLGLLFGRWTVTAALAVLLAGLTTTWVVVLISPEISAAGLAMPLFVAGVGTCAFIALNMHSVLADVPDRDTGAAGGMIITAQRVGAALGGAVIIMLVSRPDATGGFDNPTNVANGIDGVLACAVFSGAALLVAAAATVLVRKRATAAVTDFRQHAPDGEPQPTR